MCKIGINFLSTEIWRYGVSKLAPPENLTCRPSPLLGNVTTRSVPEKPQKHWDPTIIPKDCFLNRAESSCMVSDPARIILGRKRPPIWPTWLAQQGSTDKLRVSVFFSPIPFYNHRPKEYPGICRISPFPRIAYLIIFKVHNWSSAPIGPNSSGKWSGDAGSAV